MKHKVTKTGTASTIVLAALLATGCVNTPHPAYSQQQANMSVAPETPEQFLGKVYKRYRDNGPGVSISDPKVAARVYDESLLKLIQQDSNVLGESGKLDADPLCGNCQDYAISDVVILTGPTQNNHISASATFKNLGTTFSVNFDLIRDANRLKIYDLSTNGYKSLRAFLSTPAPSVTKAASPK